METKVLEQGFMDHVALEMGLEELAQFDWKD